MTTMRLVTNSVPATNVRETDDAWILEDVAFHKPLDHLDGGYTPRENVRQTATGWHGVPATLYHVRDDSGKPIAANNDPAKHVGTVEHPEWVASAEAVRAGEIRLDKADLERLGDRADGIREALESGDTLEVSSQYASADLPPGNYDGEYRTNAAAIVRPDSVAILPEGSGRCSVQEGCGINPAMAANAAVTVPMTDDPRDGEDMGANQDLELTAVGPGDVSEYTDAEWDGSDVIASLPNPSESDDAASVLDATHMVHPAGEDARDDKSNWKLPFRSGADAAVNTRALVAIDAALSGARGGVDGVGGDLTDAVSDRVQSFLDDADDDLFGAGEGDDGDMSGNSVTELVVNTVANIWPGGADSTDAETAGAESPADDDTDTDSTMKDTDKIDFIVANSDYDRENVAAWDGEDCLDTLFEQVKANADDDGGTDEDDDAPDGDVVELTEEELMERVDERAEQKAEEMVANREADREKADLAATIVANSAEYDDPGAVREDFPTVAALETKRDDVTATAGVPGTGATADFAANADDDDLADDVSAGVF